MDYAEIKRLQDKAKEGPHYTADRDPVAQGGWVWDYNLAPVTVTKAASYVEGEPDGPLGIVVWHQTSGGLQDGSRINRRYPVSGGVRVDYAPRYGETPEAWAARAGVALADVKESPIITASRQSGR
jgi:hypothetical protein